MWLFKQIVKLAWWALETYVALNKISECDKLNLKLSLLITIIRMLTDNRVVTNSPPTRTFCGAAAKAVSAIYSLPPRSGALQEWRRLPRVGLLWRGAWNRNVVALWRQFGGVAKIHW